MAPFVPYAVACGLLIFMFLAIWGLLTLRMTGFAAVAFIALTQTWTLGSCLYIESGAYITEEGIRGSFTGATFHLFLYDLWFFTAYLSILLVGNQVRQRKVPAPTPRHVATPWKAIAVQAGATLAVTALFANLLASSAVPLLNSEATRFNFWTSYARFPIVGIVLGHLSVGIAIALGVTAASTYASRYSRVMRNWGAIVLILYLVYLALAGQKFSGLFLALIAYGLPSFLHRNLRQKVLALAGRALIVVVPAGLALVYIHYAHSQLTAYVGSPLGAILYRIFGLQGHVWWGTDYRVLFLKTAAPSLAHFVVGMPALMHLVGTSAVSSYLARGVHFTMGYPAISLYSLGPFAMLVELAISATFLGLLSLYIVSLINSRSVVRSIFAVQFLFWSYSAYTQGDLWRLFTLKALVAGTILLLVEVWSRATKRRPRVSNHRLGRGTELS